MFFDQICKAFSSSDNTQVAQQFWLSYFKNKMGCHIDELYAAICELASINRITDYFNKYPQEYKMMAGLKVIDVKVNNNLVCQLIENLVAKI